ncbi:MAG: hypothetical protein SAJ37_18935 [Oscillatoria sp. PMC 1068.18]|nr:hypothetical protein [Oscillatoria sp. PMC 1076.18]MEC4990814.1 hypothetical protein [Oscillatoria sp. PMC 1068.18]
MENLDRFQEKNLNHWQLYFYLVPVLGFFPALWTLYKRQGSRQQKAVSRLSVTLALGWLLGYSLLLIGAAQTTEVFAFRLLFLNSLLSSGYFLGCLFLMVRLWQRKSLRLPGFSQVAEATFSKDLPS